MATAKQTGANATLIRGRSYSLVHPFDRRRGTYQFKKGEPRHVQDAEVVEFLRTLTETVTDGDGAEIEKPLFRITPLTAEDSKGSTARRAAPVRDEEDETYKPKTPVRPRRRA